MTIDNNDHFADLVFYHVILKCYVVIDLKLGKVKHQDIGQMNMYLKRYKRKSVQTLIDFFIA